MNRTPRPGSAWAGSGEGSRRINEVPMTEGVIDVPARAGYDRWSALYDEAPNPLVALEGPLVASLIGPVHGLAILDLGCGTGRHALRLAAEGAAVQALDFSEGMLARARTKP